MNINRYELNKYTRNNQVSITIFVDCDSNLIYKIINKSKYKIPFLVNDTFDAKFLNIWTMSRDFEVDCYDTLSGNNLI